MSSLSPTGRERPVNKMMSSSSLSPLPPQPSSPGGSTVGGGGGDRDPMSPMAGSRTQQQSTLMSSQQQQQQQQKQQSHDQQQNHGQTTDEAVLAYLRSKGLGHAALELTKLLEEQKKNGGGDDGTNSTATTVAAANTTTTTANSLRDQLEQEESIDKTKRSILAKATGGGFGYDTDSAIQIIQWGVPDVPVRLPSTERDGGDNTTMDESGDDAAQTASALADVMGLDEARAYLDSFTSIQLWVLSLADDDPHHYGGSGGVTIINPIKRAAALLKQNPNVSASTLMEGMVHQKSAAAAAKLKSDSTNKPPTSTYNLPPSAKAELLSVTFALFVHTYCELLEVGMETTAHVLRDTFKVVYEPLYQQEIKDLYQCTTTEDMMRLNSHNSQYMEALNNLKTILVQVASFQLKKEELSLHHQHHSSNSSHHHNHHHSSSVEVAKTAKMAEYDQSISVLQQKYSDLSKRASLIFSKLHDLPFLRRARAVRWQLTLSATSYGLLAGYLSSQERLLAMSTLLQAKCELKVERRDPWPYTPPIFLLEDDNDHDDNDDDDDDAGESKRSRQLEDIAWAAPLPLELRQVEAGDVTVDPDSLPFPKFHMKEQYDNEEEADADKNLVEFNRFMLVNGFRRLEALERKRTYEVMRHGKEPDPSVPAANPLEPSILLSTLCSTSSSGPVLTATTPRGFDASAIWDESGIGITCARVCPPDGRRVAAGCDDASVRIWVMPDAANPESVAETAQVLLGHKNGFPVFAVDWNRDGRCLLSAGGDGSVRLWDTMAVGPFGEVAKIKKRSSPSAAASKEGSATDDATVAGAMDVPGLHPETTEPMSGAALAVYRGHTPGTPVWSVAFAPCSYYFCSAGGDGTARLWTTDRAAPVRLFAGHTSSSVNTVEWHPNCNYILTGCEDRTARLWDIQTGRCVRLLSGCRSGISVVKVCPSGRYAAGADYSGVIHIWDLGTGKKVNELWSNNNNAHEKEGGYRASQQQQQIVASSTVSKMVHTLSYSSCGSALASGGDDCCVRVWDVRGAANHMGNPDYAEQQGWGQGAKPTIWDGAGAAVIKEPHHIYPTRRTLVMDVHYTRRNLLLSVGKFVSTATPVMATPISD